MMHVLVRMVMVLAVCTAAGCAGSADRDAAVRVYDLGVDGPAATFAGVRATGVRAAAPFDAPDMLYRLAYRDASEILAFAQSRWAAAPGVLIQRRFARASGAAPVRCTFELELSELSQVFSSRDSSEIYLEGRAMMLSAGTRVGERVIRVRESDAGAGAASGARAVARAADRMIGEISRWSAQLPACAPS